MVTHQETLPFFDDFNQPDPFDEPATDQERSDMIDALNIAMAAAHIRRGGVYVGKPECGTGGA